MSWHGNPQLIAIAKATLRVVEEGGFTTPSGERVDISRAAFQAEVGTRTLGEADVAALLAARRKPGGPSRPPRLEVTSERTQEATYRLALEGETHVALLNFASATKAGGGFLTGARAQEEDLCRCSALHGCLTTQTEFYAYHRMQGSHLYTSRMIYSPAVPFFRVKEDTFTDRAYLASVITAAAPNLPKAEKQGLVDRAEVERIVRRRVGEILAIAAAMGHRVLVLGAWGCGVFGNDPVLVADAFGTWLADPRFGDSFDRVVFAIYDARPTRPNLQPFLDRLVDRGAAPTSER